MATQFTQTELANIRMAMTAEGFSAEVVEAAMVDIEAFDQRSAPDDDEDFREDSWTRQLRSTRPSFGTNL